MGILNRVFDQVLGSSKSTKKYSSKPKGMSKGEIERLYYKNETRRIAEEAKARIKEEIRLQKSLWKK